MRTQGRLMIPVVSLLMMLAGGGILGQDKPAPTSRHDGFSMGGVGTQDRGSRPFPPDPTFNFVGSVMRLGGSPVRGVPYEERVSPDGVQSVADRISIRPKSSASVYRDSGGR